MSNQLNLSIRLSGDNGSPRLDGTFSVLDANFSNSALSRAVLTICNLARALFSCFGVSQLEVRSARVGAEASDLNGIERNVLVLSNELRDAIARTHTIATRLYIPLDPPATTLETRTAPAGFSSARTRAPMRESTPLIEPVRSLDSRMDNITKQLALGVDIRLLHAMDKLTTPQANPFAYFQANPFAYFEGEVEGFATFCRDVLDDPTFDIRGKTRDDVEKLIKTKKITNPNAPKIAFVIGLMNRTEESLGLRPL